MRRVAEVSRFYGFLVRPEDDEELFLGLEANMPRLRAKQIRYELQFHPEVKLTPEQLFDLVYAETGDKEMAQTAVRHSEWARLRNEPLT